MLAVVVAAISLPLTKALPAGEEQPSKQVDLTAMTATLRQEQSLDRVLGAVPTMTGQLVEAVAAMGAAEFGATPPWGRGLRRGPTLPAMGPVPDVRRVADAFLLAYDLRAAAARLNSDPQAQQAACHELNRELQRLAGTIEEASKRGGVSASGLSLLNYHRQRVAAVAARLGDDPTGEVAAMERAVTEADQWRQACLAGYHLAAGAERPSGGPRLPSATLEDVVRAAKNCCAARLELINATVADPAEARQARIAPLQEYQKIIERLRAETPARLTIGAAAFNESGLIASEREKAAANLAHERGDQAGEIAARKRAVAEARVRVDAAVARWRSGASGRAGAASPAALPPDMRSDVLQAQASLADAEVELAGITAADPAEARRASQKALRTHLDAAQMVVRDCEGLLKVGMASRLDLGQAACQYLLMRLQIAEFDKAHATTTDVTSP
jgi:hypothetical protein